MLQKIKIFFLLMVSFFCFMGKAESIYQKEHSPKIVSNFDRCLSRFWQSHAVKVAHEASDSVMIRRLYIDLLGRVPKPEETLVYLESQDPQKQEKLVKKLLESEEYVIFMTMRLGDEWRIKSEFPINLWPNAAFLYTKEISLAIQQNCPYDIFVRNILMSQGSNFRSGLVNFYRALAWKDTQHISDAVSQAFMGKKLAELPSETQQSLLTIFSGIRYKNTKEWKEEIVYYVPVTSDLTLDFFGKKILVSAGSDAREVFCQWLINLENPYFAQTMVKRCWRWIFGQDLEHQELVEYLAQFFKQNKYNIRALLQEICSSVAYKAGSFLPTGSMQEKTYCAVYPIRRLEAEVLADSIAQITQTPYKYSSVIPEPFSFYQCRAAALCDGSVTDSFLLLFGRPSRDTGSFDERKNDITDKQRLYLYNSSDLAKKLNTVSRQVKGQKDKIEALFLLFLSRYPTTEEHQKVQALMRGPLRRNNLTHLAWILLNSKEFMYQH